MGHSPAMSGFRKSSHPSVVRPLERRLAEAYERAGVAGKGVLLAISGGADSTAMLLATVAVRRRLRLRLAVVSVDHGLRPASREETETVATLARSFQLETRTPRLELKPGAGLEARAREARYGALEEARVALALDFTATAHTASDQAETLLMRLARGSALRGASGIQGARGPLVRPLLDWSRAEVLTYLEAQGQPFVHDPMNDDPDFFRVRIRSRVLPLLSEAAGHDTAPLLARFAQQAAEDEALLSTWADAHMERLLRSDGSLETVGLRALQPPLRRRVLARFLEARGVSLDRAVVEAATAVLTGGEAHPVSGDRTLRLRKGRLVLTLNPPRREGVGAAARKPGK